MTVHMSRSAANPEPPANVSRPKRSGILPSQLIGHLIADGAVRADEPIQPELIQPASLDLRLGAAAHRVRASFLPSAGGTVMERIEHLHMHTIDLRDMPPLGGDPVLERGCVYIVPLMERLKLPKGVSGAANPKSSTGRLGVFTRLIADGVPEFDRVPPGYEGPLYAEISPRTFSILARQGDRLSQIRFRRGNPRSTDSQLRALHGQARLVHGTSHANIADGLSISVDLVGETQERNRSENIVGYKARHNTRVIDLRKIGKYEPKEFWEPIYASDAGVNRDRYIILNPDDFYILASSERVSVPPEYAAELVPYDAQVGEFRVHYAGFFDPGFGHTGVRGKGTRAVLEVRSRDVPFVLEHGQIVGRLAYERLTIAPQKTYGRSIGSSYVQQGLALSKHFKQED